MNPQAADDFHVAAYASRPQAISQVIRRFHRRVGAFVRLNSGAREPMTLHDVWYDVWYDVHGARYLVPDT